jgi:nucleoside-diphosphate-sugar epimerase
MQILITGAAGFIGSKLARLAMTAGHGVEVFDKLTYAGMRENTTTRQAAGQSEPI